MCLVIGLREVEFKPRHLRVRQLPARQAKAAIQTLADRNPHAALRTKVGCAQIWAGRGCHFSNQRRAFADISYLRNYEFHRMLFSLLYG